MTQEPTQKKGLISIVIVSMIFGLGAGIVGELLSRVYIFDDMQNVSLFGAVNVPGGYSGSNIVISGARKVVVEQDTKAVETVNSSFDSMVGIYKAKSTETSSTLPEKSEFNLDNYYNLKDVVGQGIVLTSDGWIISSFIPAGLDAKTLADYVVITKNKEIYEIDKLVSAGNFDCFFLHVKNARDLPVKQFAQKKSISVGQAMIVVSYQGQAFFNTISDYQDENLVKSSDRVSSKISLSQQPSKNHVSSMVVALSGEVVGFIGEDLKVEPFFYLEPMLKKLMKTGEVKPSSLGINYINLFDLLAIRSDFGAGDKGAIISRDDKGVAVEKKSAADQAGLKIGDVILAIDNIEINEENNLNEIMLGYLSGDKIKLKYRNKDGEKTIDIQL